MRDGADAVLVERDAGLVTITLNRPATKNALNDDSWAGLERVLEEVWRNPADRALLITGAGGNVSSGADLSGGDLGRERESTLYEMRRVNELHLRLQRLPKPTIAVVDGVAVGVALGLALACDLVVASDRARFGAIFAKRGLVMDGGTSWSLPRLVGLRRAKQMAFFGEFLPAEQALAWGLINEVVPADDLCAVGAVWGRRLAAGPTTSLSLMKRMLDHSDGLTFEQALEEEARAVHVAYTTEDLREGMLAFLERRDPTFQGR